MPVGSASLPLTCRTELHQPIRMGLQELQQIFNGGPPIRAQANQILIQTGTVPGAAYLITTGWACRFSILPDARRAITDIYLPGDFIGLDLILEHHATDTVAMLAPGTVAAVNADDLLPALTDNPCVALAVAWLANESRRRLGRLAAATTHFEASERIALAVLDFYERLNSREPIPDGRFIMPLTQRDLAEYVGMTAVHVNRILRVLRQQRILSIDRQVLTILHRGRLVALAAGLGLDLTPPGQP
jgi:CRP-like cAMP-binding protein